HASQAAWVIVSGTSCSHVRLALRPSYIRNDGYAMSTEPPASPSTFGGATSIAAALAVTATGATAFQTPPCWSAASPGPRGSPTDRRYGSKPAQGSGPLPSSEPSTVRPSVISTSPIGRASRNGDIVGCISPTTPSRGA